MTDRPPLFDDDEILHRMERLESGGFRDDGCIVFAEELVRYARGPAAEDALRRLARRVATSRLPDLLRAHVVRRPRPDIDYCAPEHANLLAIHLTERGFVVRAGWEVTWQDGDVLEGPDLPRLALLAVWLRRMRADEER